MRLHMLVLVIGEVAARLHGLLTSAAPASAKMACSSPENSRLRKATRSRDAANERARNVSSAIHVNWSRFRTSSRGPCIVLGNQKGGKATAEVDIGG